MEFREICARLEELLPPTDYYQFMELYHCLHENEGYFHVKISRMLEGRGSHLGERCYTTTQEDDKLYIKEMIELLDGFIWYAEIDHEREQKPNVFCAYILHSVTVCEEG